MNSNKDFWDDNEFDELVKQFELKLKQKESFFFDVDDFAIIIDYYIDNGSIEMARLALRHALNLHPGSVVFQVKKAQLLAITNNTEQALSMLSIVEHLEPYNTDIIKTKANIFSQLQQYDNAIKEYKKLSVEDDAEEIFSNIAFEYENMGQFSEAIRYLKKVLAINPGNDNAMYELAYCFEATGDVTASIKYFQAYLEENPLSSIAWFNLGVACSTVDRFEEALEAFDFSIALEPDYASAYFNKATVLCNQERYHEAIEAYGETLNLEQPDALTFQYIGECYEKLCDYDNAIEHYLKAIETNENLSEGWAGLASVFYETGNYDKAMSFILKARKMNNNNADFALLQGDICKATQDYEMAAIAYQRARELNEDDHEAWMDLAEVTALKDEDINAGIDILLEAHARFPDNASLLYRISFYFFTSESEKEGLAFLEEALFLDYEKHTEFLSLDESLLEHPGILQLIEQAKLYYQNS